MLTILSSLPTHLSMVRGKLPLLDKYQTCGSAPGCRSDVIPIDARSIHGSRPTAETQWSGPLLVSSRWLETSNGSYTCMIASPQHPNYDLSFPLPVKCRKLKIVTVQVAITDFHKIFYRVGLVFLQPQWSPSNCISKCSSDCELSRSRTRAKVLMPLLMTALVRRGLLPTSSSAKCGRCLFRPPT
jgi:hypothetical protein